MLCAVFVAPFFLPTTLRFVAAAASVPGVRLSVVTQEPKDKLPSQIRSRLGAYVQVADALTADGIRQGLAQVEASQGHMDRLLGALENLQEPLGAIRDELGIPGMGAAAASNFRDKSRMKDLLRDNGLPCARHHLIRSESESDAVLAKVGLPLVLKPPSGSGARGTFHVETIDQLHTALSISRPNIDRPVLAEEFIQGEEHSFDAVSIGGRIVWHSISHYLPTPLDVIRQPWIQWCVMLPREVDAPRYEEIRRVAGPTLRTLGMNTGLSHMEWFRRSDGTVAISEVGARPPGAQFVTLISYAHDVDFYAAWAGLMTLGKFEPPRRPFAAGVAYLRGQGRGKVRAVEGIEGIAQDLGPLCVESRLPRPGQSPSGSYEGEGYIIVRHPRTEVVQDALGQIITRTRVILDE